MDLIRSMAEHEGIPQPDEESPEEADNEEEDLTRRDNIGK
jgi:hypothetical protein